ncbi:MAG: hypothetical protein KDE27_11780 [Planctomycetes bacterium]|nr:hypothetical protein [Planctomycetota bacterium]
MAAKRRSAKTRLERLLARLEPVDVEADDTADPWRAILRENVAYLAKPAARAQAFARLLELTDGDAGQIARCPDELLHECCGGGRMADQQVEKLRRCAALFREVGDPRELVALPRPAAKKALRRFPGIGEPGGDKLRLFAGAEPVVTFESNGLRVLQRLGYGTAEGAYAQNLRAVCAAVEAELPRQVQPRVQAFLRLRELGRSVCRQSTPDCSACPLAADCPASR